MRVLITILAVMCCTWEETSASCLAQSLTNGNESQSDKTTEVEVAPTQTLSSKELRKAEKMESDSQISIENVKAKIQELEDHIKRSSDNPGYNADAANSRLQGLREELTRLQKHPK